MSSKTPCAVCGKPIKRGTSYAEPKWLSGPAHFRCAYPEMAVTTGDRS